MDQPISKTQRKKTMHALQRLGEQLVALSPVQLEQIDLAEKLRDAIIETRKLKTYEARRRQLQYIGRLMRETDAALIQQKLDYALRPQKYRQARQNLIECWRERLLSDERALVEFLQIYQQADRQRLRMLVRNAQHESLERKPPKSFRALFQELQQLIPLPRFDE
ncbi:MAG TPA: ribosome biogenesis factor YjgA [Burkholderiales bacterium]|nr:ribosome biogenesis factor YjgA [Burkholderiales bacterium]